MTIAVVTFPGSNCDRDCVYAVENAGADAVSVWHDASELPDGTTGVILPGGFSYGDYLRTGAIAARASIMPAVQRFAQAGGAVLGICNGFQILCEVGLLPGALAQNASGRFVCEDVQLNVDGDASLRWTKPVGAREIVLPVAHGAGRYVADTETLKMLDQTQRIAFSYVERDDAGRARVNGSERAIAGIVGGPERNVLGMMPHPERALDGHHGGAGAHVIAALVSFAREGAS